MVDYERYYLWSRQNLYPRADRDTEEEDEDKNDSSNMKSSNMAKETSSATERASSAASTSSNDELDSSENSNNSTSFASECVDCSTEEIALCPPCTSNQRCVSTTRTCSQCASAYCEDLDSDGPSAGTIVGVSVGCAIGVALIVGVLFMIWRRRKKANMNAPTVNDTEFDATMQSRGMSAFGLYSGNASQMGNSFYQERGRGQSEKSDHFLSFGSQFADGRDTMFSGLGNGVPSATINQAHVLKPAQAKPKVVNIELMRTESPGSSLAPTVDEKEVSDTDQMSQVSSNVSIVGEIMTSSSPNQDKRSTQIYEFKRLKSITRSVSRREKAPGGGNRSGASSESVSEVNKITSRENVVAPLDAMPSTPLATYNRPSRRIVPDQDSVDSSLVDNAPRPMVSTRDLATVPAAVTSPPSPTVSNVSHPHPLHCDGSGGTYPNGGVKDTSVDYLLSLSAISQASFGTSLMNSFPIPPDSSASTPRDSSFGGGMQQDGDNSRNSAPSRPRLNSNPDRFQQTPPPTIDRTLDLDSAMRQFRNSCSPELLSSPGLPPLNLNQVTVDESSLSDLIAQEHQLQLDAHVNQNSESSLSTNVSEQLHQSSLSSADPKKVSSSPPASLAIVTAAADKRSRDVSTFASPTSDTSSPSNPFSNSHAIFDK
ncbi:hypothetical protein IWQ61_004486 [Dispira simplex]|nr:hypothetical protein IWQ61_004486 [Dispira simplex]